MENNEKLKEFYRLVKKAREACAGAASVEPFSNVIYKVSQAFYYGVSNHMSTVHLDKLIGSKRLLQHAKEYGDRLRPDELLCEVCNELLKEVESK